jgi:hypothetical protein
MRKAKGIAAIVLGTALMAAGGWAVWWGLTEVTALPAFDGCGFGQTVNDAGDCADNLDVVPLQ